MFTDLNLVVLLVNLIQDLCILSLKILHVPELSCVFVSESYLLLLEFSFKALHSSSPQSFALPCPCLVSPCESVFLFSFFLIFLSFCSTGVVPSETLTETTNYQDCLVLNYTHLEMMNVDSRTSTGTDSVC